jgi:AraC-like DNA-binding protein
MKAYFEKVPVGTDSLLVFERADSSFPFDWHYHPEFELTLIVKSAGQRLVGNSYAEYGSGDLVLIGPNLPHTWRSSPLATPAKKGHRAVVVQFGENFLGDEFFALPEMTTVARLLARSAVGLEFGRTKLTGRVREELTRLPQLSPARRLVSLLDVLLDLAAEAEVKSLSTGSVRSLTRPMDRERIDAVCRYLDQLFQQEIDYGKLARLVHMDQASLCRFFKRATGRTMTTYVTELRVAAATQLLLESDLSVLEIGLRAGFGNYSNFNKQFRRLKGLSPRALRAQIEPQRWPQKKAV